MLLGTSSESTLEISLSVDIRCSAYSSEDDQQFYGKMITDSTWSRSLHVSPRTVRAPRFDFWSKEREIGLLSLHAEGYHRWS